MSNINCGRKWEKASKQANRARLKVISQLFEIIFEYILLPLNTRPEDVKNLKNISKMFDCHFNFIRYNEVPESGLKALTEKEIQEFFNACKTAGVSCTVRRTLGDDIDGACGQLRRRVLSELKGE